MTEPEESEAAAGSTSGGLKEMSHSMQAKAGPLYAYAIRGFLTLAAHEHKLDDGEQFLEIDRLADDFLRMQRPGVLE